MPGAPLSGTPGKGLECGGSIGSDYSEQAAGPRVHNFLGGRTLGAKGWLLPGRGIWLAFDPIVSLPEK